MIERESLERVALLLFFALLLTTPSCSLFRKAPPADPPAGPSELSAGEEPSSVPPPSTQQPSSPTAAPTEQPSSPTAEPNPDYIIGSGDLMNILVYGEPDLTGVTRVSNEGFIELPLIGQVRAAGLTAPQLKQSIEAKLKQGYLVNPDVQIILQDYQQDVVHLMGQVATPGPYRITHGNTLMGTISKAGGFTPIAKRNKVKIIRKENGRSRVFFVDTLRITKEGKMEDDVPLKPGDVIIVPERFF